MKRAFIAVLGALALLAAQTPEPGPTVQPCTSVSVETLDAVDSAHAKPGDFFRFQTMQPTTDGSKHLVIPAHTVGYGIVALVVSAGKQGRSGALLLEPLYLKMADGRRLGVVLNYGIVDDIEKQGKSGELIPGYLGLVPVPGLGVAIGAVNYFRHGKDITIKKGTPFAIFPEDDPHSAFCQPG